MDSRESRFFSKVDKSISSGCWEWQGALAVNGYGVFRWGGNPISMTTHRASWLIHRGPINDDLCVLHHCDNRKCVNPDHLYLGTKKQNAEDASKRGRMKAKEGDADFVRTQGLAQRVFDLRAHGCRNADIASWLGIGVATVYRVRQQA